MKICICTTPIRPIPTTYPPMGSMAIIQSLRHIGENPNFFNIDYFRPDTEAVKKHFLDHQYDIVGISAVVSTAYAYTKFLCNLIREASPKTIIIVGGNLAASAEILIRKCGVDICVSGDGEIIIQNLIQLIRDGKMDPESLATIKGVCFLDNQGDFRFTGFGPRPEPDEIEFPDYTILGGDDVLEYFIPQILDDRFSGIVPEGGWPEGRMATVPTTKGCVSRCTFCHRWEKGYRVMSLSNISDHLELLQTKYNVKYIDVADENFGSDKLAARQFAEEMLRLGMTWRAGGVRASTVNPEVLKFWKECGCSSVIYGMESGSKAMLEVMEKKITVEQNFDAVKWTYEAGILTVIQLIIGMPGETDKTIRESIEFLKSTTDYLFLGEGLPSSLLSLNYAQALPGTPLYEYAREHGFIGKDIDAEEKYLLRISDTDAYNSDHFINYTGLPLLKVLVWQQQIAAEVDADYIQRKFGTRYTLAQVFSFYVVLVIEVLKRKFASHLVVREAEEEISYKKTSGYFNIRKAGKFTPVLLNPLTKPFLIPMIMMGLVVGKSKDLHTAVALVSELLFWFIKRPFVRDIEAGLPQKSLRKIVQIVPAKSTEVSNENMLPLRRGR